MKKNNVSAKVRRMRKKRRHSGKHHNLKKHRSQWPLYVVGNDKSLKNIEGLISETKGEIRTYEGRIQSRLKKIRSADILGIISIFLTLLSIVFFSYVSGEKWIMIMAFLFFLIFLLIAAFFILRGDSLRYSEGMFHWEYQVSERERRLEKLLKRRDELVGNTTEQAM